MFAYDKCNRCNERHPACVNCSYARDIAIDARLEAAGQSVPQQPPTGWQDIATAPKEIEFRCLVGHEHSVVTAYWDGQGWKNERSTLGSYFKPTHWMPLPAAPGAQQAEKGTQEGLEGWSRLRSVLLENHDPPLTRSELEHVIAACETGGNIFLRCTFVG